jgi:hypothetical protein
MVLGIFFKNISTILERKRDFWGMGKGYNYIAPKLIFLFASWGVLGGGGGWVKPKGS